MAMPMMVGDVDVVSMQGKDYVSVGQVEDLVRRFLNGIPVGQWPLGEDVSPHVFALRDYAGERVRVVAMPVSPPDEEMEDRVESIVMGQWLEELEGEE